MTEELIKAARQLSGSCSVADIARKLGVSRTTLYAHMDEIGRREPPAVELDPPRASACSPH
jgi:predicted ArsR family transcriptional regulator